VADGCGEQPARSRRSSRRCRTRGARRENAAPDAGDHPIVCGSYLAESTASRHGHVTVGAFKEHAFRRVATTAALFSRDRGRLSPAVSDREVRRSVLMRRFEGFFDLVRDAQRFTSRQRPHGQAMITTARMRAPHRARSIRTISEFSRTLSNTICLPSVVTSKDCVAAESFKRLSWRDFSSSGRAARSPAPETVLARTRAPGHLERIDSAVLQPEAGLQAIRPSYRPLERPIKPSNVFLTPHNVKLLELRLGAPGGGAVAPLSDQSHSQRDSVGHSELHGTGTSDQ
jgi:hypothetical protein